MKKEAKHLSGLEKSGHLLAICDHLFQFGDPLIRVGGHSGDHNVFFGSNVVTKIFLVLPPLHLHVIQAIVMPLQEWYTGLPHVLRNLHCADSELSDPRPTFLVSFKESDPRNP